MEVGAFEAHTTGFGSKMLKKWGWKEGKGLGLREDGRSEAIKVHVRPPCLGLRSADLMREPKRRRIEVQPEEVQAEVQPEVQAEVAPMSPLSPFFSEDLYNFVNSVHQEWRERVEKFPEPAWSCTINQDIYSKFMVAFPEQEVGLELIRDSILASCTSSSIWRGLDYLDDFAIRYSESEFKRCKLDVLSFCLSLPTICSEVQAWKVNLTNKRERNYDLDDQLRFLYKCHNYLRPHVNFHTHMLWSFINDTVFAGKIQRITEESWHLGINDSAIIDILSAWYPYINLDSFLENFVIQKLLTYTKNLPWRCLFPSCRCVVVIDDEGVHESDSFIDLTSDGSSTRSGHAPDDIDLQPLLPWMQFHHLNTEPLVWCIFEHAHQEARKFKGNRIDSAEFKAGISHFQSIPEVLEQLVDSIVLPDMKKYILYVKDLILELDASPEARYADAKALSMVKSFLQWQDIVRDSELVDLLEEHFFHPWLNLFHRWLKCRTDTLEFYTRWKQTFVDCDLLYPPILTCFESALHMARVEMELSFVR